MSRLISALAAGMRPPLCYTVVAVGVAAEVALVVTLIHLVGR